MLPLFLAARGDEARVVEQRVGPARAAAALAALPRDELIARLRSAGFSSLHGTAVSADGLRWTSSGHKWGRNADRQGCLYHDALGGDYEYMLADEFPTPHSYRDIRGTQLVRVGDAEGGGAEGGSGGGGGCGSGGRSGSGMNR